MSVDNLSRVGSLGNQCEDPSVAGHSLQPLTTLLYWPPNWWQRSICLQMTKHNEEFSNVKVILTKCLSRRLCLFLKKNETSRYDKIVCLTCCLFSSWIQKYLFRSDSIKYWTKVFLTSFVVSLLWKSCVCQNENRAQNHEDEFRMHHSLQKLNQQTQSSPSPTRSGLQSDSIPSPMIWVRVQGLNSESKDSSPSPRTRVPISNIYTNRHRFSINWQ